MAKIIAERMCAQIDGDFVVFLIGIRINKPWKLHKWLPVFFAMPRMLKELGARPDSGFLGSESAGFTVVQYWRSFEALEAYARDARVRGDLQRHAATRPRQGRHADAGQNAVRHRAWQDGRDGRRDGRLILKSCRIDPYCGTADTNLVSMFARFSRPSNAALSTDFR